jgi:WD40 repeat protein
MESSSLPRASMAWRGFGISKQGNCAPCPHCSRTALRGLACRGTGLRWYFSVQTEWSTVSLSTRGPPSRWSYLASSLCSPDGRTLLSRSLDGTAQAWNVTTGAPSGSLLPHASAVSAVAFSPDGRRIATGTAKGEVRIWNSTKPPAGPRRRRSGSSFSPRCRTRPRRRGESRHLRLAISDCGSV